MAAKPGPILLLGGLAALLLAMRKKDEPKIKPKKEGEECDPGWTEVEGDCILFEEDRPSPTPPPRPDDKKSIDEAKKKAKDKAKGWTPEPPEEMTPDELWVSADCGEVIFGDGTGEAWWKAWGKPMAYKWKEKGWKNPEQIAAGMLIDYAPNCIILWPERKDMQDSVEFEYWIDQFYRQYPKVYYLIYWLRNHIDVEFYDGKQSVIFEDDCNSIFVGEDWWEEFGIPMAAVYLQQELIEFDGDAGKSWEYGIDDESLSIWNAAGAIISRMDVNRLFLDPEDTCSGMLGINWQKDKRPPIKEIPEALNDKFVWLEEMSSSVLEDLEGGAIVFNPNQ